jgi:aminoglycoside phosphotransferase (APT) family kinase protein
MAAHDPYPAPPDRTARRLEWAHLPPHVRDLVARRCGSEVVDAVSQTSGFTPGFASVLTCADGSRHFVKAASAKAQRMFAESYREEARKLVALPEGVPAPRLLWSHDGDWVVLGIEHVDGRLPGRPWSRADLDATLDALEVVADALTPAPAALDLAPFAEDFKSFVAGWDHVRAARPHLPRLDEAADLAAGFEAVTAGDSLVHTDVRADNVLLDGAGKAWICDWNWPVAGAPWLDSFLALIGPRGDGLDVAPDLASRRLLADVPAESVDVALALVTGYFLSQCDLPVPPTSPHLRDHQRWQGEVCWAWLAERRGWS